MLHSLVDSAFLNICPLVYFFMQFCFLLIKNKYVSLPPVFRLVSNEKTDKTHTNTL